MWWQKTSSLLESVLQYAAEERSHSKLWRVLGEAEGTRLKSLGLISAELYMGLRHCAGVFGLELGENEGFKVPFREVTLPVAIQTSEQKPEDEENGKPNRNANGESSRERGNPTGLLPTKRAFGYWLEGLLSSYNLGSVRGEWLESGTRFRLTHDSAIRPGVVKGEGDGAFRHKANNYLGGIISFASLLQKDPKTTDSGNAILESARHLKNLVDSYFSPPPSK